MVMQDLRSLEGGFVNRTKTFGVVPDISGERYEGESTGHHRVGDKHGIVKVGGKQKRNGSFSRWSFGGVILFHIGFGLRL